MNYPERLARILTSGRRVTAVALLAFLPACALLGAPATPITEFYVLSATAEPEEPAGGRLILGLGPVTMPSYLERPEMVTRIAENQVVFDELNRWAEPLRSNFIHVLATDLDVLIGVRQLFLYPWYDTAPVDYAVAIAVLRFERQWGNTAVLSARWLIRNRAGEVLVTRESQHQHPAESPAQTAAALSAVTADLARDIATALRGLR